MLSITHLKGIRNLLITPLNTDYMHYRFAVLISYVIRANAEVDRLSLMSKKMRPSMVILGYYCQIVTKK
jgi:hypothetical protein